RQRLAVGQLRLGPVDAALVQPTVVTIQYQQFDLAVGGTRHQPLRLHGAFQRQGCKRVPTIRCHTVAVQLAGVGIQRQQAARYRSQTGDQLLQTAEGLEHVHRLAAQLRFGMGAVGPDADAFLVDVEQVLLLIHGAVFGFWRQAKAAYMGGLIQQLTGRTDQPLIALAFLTDNEQVQVAGIITVQAQILDAVVAARQHQFPAYGQVVAVGLQQDRLLQGGVGGGDQELLIQYPGIQGAEVAGVLAQSLATVIQQPEAIGVSGQALAVVQQQPGFGALGSGGRPVLQGGALYTVGVIGVWLFGGCCRAARRGSLAGTGDEQAG